MKCKTSWTQDFNLEFLKKRNYPFQDFNTTRFCRDDDLLRSKSKIGVRKKKKRSCIKSTPLTTTTEFEIIVEDPKFEVQDNLITNQMLTWETESETSNQICNKTYENNEHYLEAILDQNQKKNFLEEKSKLSALGEFEDRIRANNCHNLKKKRNKLYNQRKDLGKENQKLKELIINLQRDKSPNQIPAEWMDSKLVIQLLKKIGNKLTPKIYNKKIQQNEGKDFALGENLISYKRYEEIVKKKWKEFFKHINLMGNKEIARDHSKGKTEKMNRLFIIYEKYHRSQVLQKMREYRCDLFKFFETEYKVCFNKLLSIFGFNGELTKKDKIFVLRELKKGLDAHKKEINLKSPSNDADEDQKNLYIEVLQIWESENPWKIFSDEIQFSKENLTEKSNFFKNESWSSFKSLEQFFIVQLFGFKSDSIFFQYSETTKTKKLLVNSTISIYNPKSLSSNLRKFLLESPLFYKDFLHFLSVVKLNYEDEADRIIACWKQNKSLTKGLWSMSMSLMANKIVFLDSYELLYKAEDGLCGSAENESGIIAEKL